MCFASAGRRIGSWHVVLLRSLLAFLLLIALLPIYAWITREAVTVPTTAQTLWLLASALAGMVVGDVALISLR
jgi:hypothetical protein